MKIKELLSSFSFASIIWFLTARVTEAVCPVCTVAVGAGLAVSRSLGVSDSVSGTWFGALLMSMTLWTIDWLSKKKINQVISGSLSFVTYYGLTLWWLLANKYIGIPGNSVNVSGLAIDKLLLGLFIGSIVLYLGGKLYLYLKKKNGGRAHFPFEKVVIPFGLVLIVSGIIFLIIW